jgi:hypothetical protein
MDDEQDMFERAAYFFSHDYHDRGMVKWQGYYLSDHTEDVKKKEALEFARQNRKRMPEMALADITAILFDAFGRHEEVAVQENYSDTDGTVPPIITGLVTGYTESDIIIGATHIPLANLWWAQKTQ